MSIKYKPTGCTKFLLVLIVLIPLAYFSAKLITGEDPMSNVYELLGKEPKNTSQTQINLNAESQPLDTNNNSDLNKSQIEQRILELEKELEWLKNELKKQEN